MNNAVMMPHDQKASRTLPPGDWADAIVQGDRTLLARAITLIESTRADDFVLARDLISRLLPSSGKALRIGITGVPGVGKSTLIECLGLQLCEKGHRLAVLAIDPSSSISGGSILGDKTRMEQLSQHPGSFIRPSPSAGTLGGVTRKTRESLLLCEAAGYNIVLIETVGVGQSEMTVHSMTDLFLLLMLPGAGDELQGIKKGILELADLIAVTKSDGDNVLRAGQARQELENAVHFMTHKPTVMAISSQRKDSVAALWQKMEEIIEDRRNNGAFEARRLQQNEVWFDQLLQDEAIRRFFQHPSIISILPHLQTAVRSGTLTPDQAIQHLPNL